MPFFARFNLFVDRFCTGQVNKKFDWSTSDAFSTFTLAVIFLCILRLHIAAVEHAADFDPHKLNILLRIMCRTCYAFVVHFYCTYLAVHIISVALHVSIYMYT